MSSLSSNRFQCQASCQRNRMKLRISSQSDVVRICGTTSSLRQNQKRPHVFEIRRGPRTLVMVIKTVSKNLEQRKAQFRGSRAVCLTALIEGLV